MQVCLCVKVHTRLVYFGVLHMVDIHWPIAKQWSALYISPVAHFSTLLLCLYTPSTILQTRGPVVACFEVLGCIQAQVEQRQNTVLAMTQGNHGMQRQLMDWRMASTL